MIRAFLYAFHRDSNDISFAELYLGLCTVYHINGITVAAYGRRHRTIRVLSRFVSYPATAQLTPYFTAFYGRRRPYIRLPISVKIALLTLFTLLLQALKP